MRRRSSAAASCCANAPGSLDIVGSAANSGAGAAAWRRVCGHECRERCAGNRGTVTALIFGHPALCDQSRNGRRTPGRWRPEPHPGPDAATETHVAVPPTRKPLSRPCATTSPPEGALQLAVLACLRVLHHPACGWRGNETRSCLCAATTLGVQVGANSRIFPSTAACFSARLATSISWVSRRCSTSRFSALMSLLDLPHRGFRGGSLLCKAGGVVECGRGACSCHLRPFRHRRHRCDVSRRRRAGC